jgi:hypothetical protein
LQDFSPPASSDASAINVIAQMSERPTYMIAPNWDTPPNDTIRLGNIIKDPMWPDRSLNSESRIEPDSTTTTTKPDWSLSYSDLFSLNAGLATSFLAPLIGLGGDIAGKTFSNKESVLKCQKLETSYFSPSDKYIAQSLSSTTVKIYLKKNFWKSIYMVTGLKVAHGGSIQAGKDTGVGGDASVTVDATMLAGIPVEETPHLSTEKSHKQAVSFGLCDEPFIIGYRLLKITPKFNGEFKDKPFNKFALLSDDQESLTVGQEVLELLHQDFEIKSIREQKDIDGRTSDVWCASGLFHYDTDQGHQRDLGSGDTFS